MTDTTPGAGQMAPLVDRAARPRSVSRLIFLALVMIGASIVFFLFKDSLDNELMLAFLGILAVVGIFFLVSTVIGFVAIMPKAQSDPLARAFTDTHPEGTLVTDTRDRVIYANQAYGRITGLVRAEECSRSRRSCRATRNRPRRSTG